MSEPVRLAVLELFGARSARWRRPIEAAAVAQGWDYHEYWGGEAPVLKPDRSSVVICSDTAQPGLENMDWFVISSPPQEVCDELLGHGLTSAEARHHASRRLAQASTLIQMGADAASAYDAHLALPGLGLITIEDAAAETTPIGTGELAFYGHLPPKCEDVVDIPLEAMTFPIYRASDDGSNRISLLGRRRIIFHGPNYVLPQGEWVVRARFAIDCDHQIHLLFGWGCELALEKVEHRTLNPGIYDIELRNRWPEFGTAELSCTVMTPVLEGTITLDSVSISYAG